ncbi:MAG TPA: heme anaerobic degradation radical SAM methyltransferase ChuW/HutW, partial [Desulfobacterales bacterium]|nr:heme anaerobic degradation radical SAM methyltransferase ChuW/HutW [Desulfobacterales bacterium]
MNWTAEAEQLLEKMPAFVSDRFRKKLEDKAAQQKRTQIDSAFVKDQQGGHKHQGYPPPRVTNDPIAEAFERKYAVHAGMMGGTPCGEDFETALWREVSLPSPDIPGMAYIHIPFCSSRCHFCGFYAEVSVPDVMADYTRALIAEIKMSGRYLKEAGQTLQAVYFGGGTPTDLSGDDLSRLVQTIRSELPLSNDCEITLEGRLYGFVDKKVQAVLDSGVNRFSFGVQSFNTKIRQQVGRKQPREEVIERLNRIVDLAEPHNAAVIIDLIFGLPGQGEVDWLGDIDCAIHETGIHGLDLYQINIIPSTPLLSLKDKLPPMATLRQRGKLFSIGRKRMIDAKFERLSIAHWRRDPRERNRYNSWNKMGSNCLPLGSGAGGRWGKTRFFQQNDLKLYLAAIKNGEKPLAMGMISPDHTQVSALAVGQLEQQQLDIVALEKVAG